MPHEIARSLAFTRAFDVWFEVAALLAARSTRDITRRRSADRIYDVAPCVPVHRPLKNFP